MADELSRAQKIAILQQQGIIPPSSDIAPTGGTELTRDQKIQALTKAGVSIPQAAPAQEPGFMDRNINPLSGVPLIGGGDITPNDMIHGAINDLPLAGGVIGGVIGAGVGVGLNAGVPTPMAVVTGGLGAGYGAQAGSYAKDTLNNLIYGKQTSLVEAHQNAINAQSEMATGAILGEGAGVIAGKAATAALATKSGSKVGSLLSGVPDSLVKAYADGAARIKTLFQDAGESDFRMAEAARKKFVTDLSGTRSALGKQVEEGVAGSTETINTAPIIKQLEDASAKLDPTLERDTGQIQEIEKLIYKVKDLSGPEGKLSLQDAAKLNSHFQAVADAANAYGKPGASSVTNQVGFAAKTSGGVTRKLMNEVAPEVVVKANNQLSTLHKIEDSMNVEQLLNPRGKTPALIDAGKNASGKNYADLQDIQAITGTNMTGAAQDVATAQAFGKYKFTPTMSAPWSALGQPTVKGIVDAATAAATGQAGAGTLGQAIMHGTGAMDSLKRVGQ